MVTDADGWVALKENKLFNYSPISVVLSLVAGSIPASSIITVELHSEQLTWLSLSLGDLPIEDWFNTPEMLSVLSIHKSFF